MAMMRNLLALFLLSSLGAIGTVAPSSAQQAARDGSKDFDWEIGTWETHVKVLRRPLTPRRKGDRTV